MRRSVVLSLLVLLACAASAGASTSDLAGWTCSVQATSFDPTEGSSNPVTLQCVKDDQQAETFWGSMDVATVTGNSCGWTATGTLQVPPNTAGSLRTESYTLHDDTEKGTITLGSGGTGPALFDPGRIGQDCLTADAGGPKATSLTAAFVSKPTVTPPPVTPPPVPKATVCVAQPAMWIDFDGGFRLGGITACQDKDNGTALGSIEGSGEMSGSLCTVASLSGRASVPNRELFNFAITYGGTAGLMSVNGRPAGVATVLPGYCSDFAELVLVFAF